MADLFSGLSIDLSLSCEKLAKMCGSSIVVNDECIQKAGRAAINALAKRCLQPNAAKTLLSYLLGVLTGNEGKLATATQKISIISAIREVMSFKYTYIYIYIYIV